MVHQNPNKMLPNSREDIMTPTSIFNHHNNSNSYNNNHRCCSTDSSPQKKRFNNNKETSSSSIFRWLNPFNQNHHQKLTSRLSEPDLKNSDIQINNRSIDENFGIANGVNGVDELRGVQNLKHFWNSRISALKDAKTKSATLNGGYGRSTTNRTNLTGSKSISCLLNNNYNSNEKNSNSENLTSHCTINNRDIWEIDKINIGHKDIDNFYKYKTAATTKRFSCESNNLNETVLSINRLSNTEKIPTKISGNFPLVAATSKGGRIHWAKRDDIKINRKQKISDNDNMAIAAAISSSSATSGSDDCALETLNIITINSDKNHISDDSDTVIAQQNNIDCDKNIKKMKSSQFDKAAPKIINKTETDKTDDDNNISDCVNNCEATLIKAPLSRNSSINSLLSCESPSRKRNSNSARKYSFKTHAKTYYPSRKMTSTANGSKVATLTQKFNAMIQKDAAILNEIKKNNGIIMSRAGHVYRIKEETDVGRKKSIRKSNDDDSIGFRSGQRKRTSIRRSKDSVSNNGVSTVKTTIEKFEKTKSNENSPIKLITPISQIQKPKVPSKSQQVLQKTKEIVIRNTQKKLPKSVKNELKLDLHQPKILEKIKEETKTPITDNAVISIVPEKTETIAVPNMNVEPESAEQISTTSIDELTLLENLTQDNDNDERLAKKSKYAKIYEKFRFRSPFIGKKNKNSSKNYETKIKISDDVETIEAPETIDTFEPPIEAIVDTEVMDACETVETVETIENLEKLESKETNREEEDNDDIFETLKVLNNEQSSLDRAVEAINVITIEQFNEQKELDENSDRKIREALQTVNKKIENLSVNCSLKTETNCESKVNEIDEKPLTNEVIPNESFLFRWKNVFVPDANEPTDHACNDQNSIEAVNTTLINKTQSMDNLIGCPSLQIKQNSLEERREYPNLLKQTGELLTRLKDSNIVDESCDEEELYEPIAALNTIKKPESSPQSQLSVPISHPPPPPPNPQKSFLFRKQSEAKTMLTTKCSKDDIYQTVVEAKNFANVNQPDLISGDYDCCENYESIASTGNNCEPAVNTNEDGYEICDPPEPPPPRKVDPEIRNTTDKLPAIPAPKRPKKNPQIYGDYPYPAAVRITKTLPDIPTSTTTTTTSASSITISSNYSIEQHYNDENIYDTIKGAESLSHCYEIVNTNQKNHHHHHNHLHHHHHQPKSLDTMSMTSNCYESINSFRRMPILQSAGSTSTISSDQKTNSLYGMSMDHCGGHSSNSNNGGSSDNSDDWVDISDPEDSGSVNGIKQQYIVVRERVKYHTPDWSKKIRDKRRHQTINSDDSDHYYEPLFPSANKTSNLINTQMDKIPPQSNKIILESNDLQEPLKRLQLPNLVVQDRQQNMHRQSNGNQTCYSDDYDSFDTDDDYADEDIKKNDSGVDISNARLPDPPTPTNQVYAFVKKFKNFISNKRNPQSSKNADTCGKTYENTQFYVGTNEYQNTDITYDSNVNKSGKNQKSKQSNRKQLKASMDDLYENTEFHTPISAVPIVLEPTRPAPPIPTTPSTLQASRLSQSEKNLIATTDSDELVSRKKSKNGKSFKSKLRKSLGGGTATDSAISISNNTLNATRSTFYISDTPEMDSGMFETIPPGELNLNDGSSGEIPKPEIMPRKPKKTISAEDLIRRKTTIGIRPNDPPPPPPNDRNGQNKRSSTSWYAECGVFKANNINLNSDERGERTSNTSWYAEAGLYQTSGASVASSSGSSGVSTGGEGGPGDDNSHSMFLNEPLYQIYSAAKLESISRDMEDQDSTDGYEAIGSNDHERSNRGDRKKKTLRPSALQLVGPKQGPSRTLWSEISEVVNSEILSSLTPTERRLQEAKFEILTSEASYLKSLNLLRAHFMNHPAFRDGTILSSSDRKTMFSHIIPVYDCSDRLLCDLESCWQDNIMLLGLSKSIYKHAEKYFQVYVSFCEHQGKMDRTLRRLKEAKGIFSQTLEMLESDPLCCALNLHSFLMLPMQRITRLPLLIDAVFSKVKPDDDEYDDWKMTLSILNKIVAQCNEAANRCEQAYEIEKISRQIEFPTNIRSLAISPVGVSAPGSKPRFLVKRGELTHLIWRGDDAKLTFGKKFMKYNIYAFLFTDLLVLTKRKAENQFTVFDYCPRSMLTISSGDVIPQLPTKDIAQAGKNLILMTLLENNEGKTVELVLSCPSVSEQQRWLQATAPPEAETPGEKLYEQWDCPQVIAKHEYISTEPDLLTLEPGDVVNVTRKLPDGWYQGERIRDGVTGWFPGNFTEEVNSSHVRARNLKQRYRLLTFTATYLESQKRK